MSFDPQEIAELAAFAEHLADAARSQTLPHFRDRAAVTDKEGPVFDPVTDADRNAERKIRALIEAAYPGHAILGEEFGEKKGEGPWRWVIDPIDGTRAFVCGAPTWVTLIALEHDGAPVLGLIDQPYTDERWLAQKGAVFQRGKTSGACRVSGVTDLGRARLSTTDPRAAGGYFSDAEAGAFARLCEKTQVQRFSLDAYAYALLALGELDLVVETTLQRHDYAALIPVIEGAGGVVTNWRGAPVGSDERGEILAAATPELHEAAMGVLKA